MITVYAVKIDSEPDTISFRELLQKITPDKKKTFLKFHRKEDAYRSLYAELLIRYLLIQHHHFPHDTIKFHYTEYGKPYLQNNSNLHFNLSHSGQWVVCAISEKPVGIDIEKLSSIDLTIAEHVFSQAEMKHLFSLNENERISCFFSLWTLKESYIKMKGKGLSMELKEFSIFLKEENIFIENDDEKERVYFKQYTIDNEYAMAVCSLEQAFSAITMIDQKELTAFGLQL